MNYSRRQLEAFGEPLGESATRLKLGGRIYGGGGGSGPAQSQTQTVDLPEWAQPHAKKILAKGEALSEAPYQKYGGDRTALFTDLQKGAMEGARTMGPASQLGTATGLAGDVGRRAMDTNYQAGQFSGGQFGGNEAQQYMNPYMQNVVDIQQREAQRQADISGTQRGAQAVKSGAFGGSRQAIVDAEAARNLATQKGDIQAQGLNQSYQQAMAQFNADQARRMQADQLGEQSRQYGAGLGLQGLQTGLQAAGTLGQLGGQQFQQGMDINKLRSAYGGMEQALNQRGLDVKYQDFMNEENYPYKQLGFYSDLLRGTPTGSSSVTNMYQPQGSGLQDIAGLGMGMYGLSKFMAEGGEVKTYAGDEGSVTSQGNVKSIIDKLGPEQLQAARENALDRRDMDTVAAIDERMAELAQSKSLTAGLGSAFDQIPAEQQEQMMAGGGIVAMAGGGSYRQKTDESLKGLSSLVDEYKPQTADQYQAGVEKRMPFVEKLYGPDVTAGYLEEVKAERANLGKNTDEAKGLGALLAAAEMIGAKNIREGASKSVKAFTGEVARVAKETKEAKDRLRQSEITLATAQQARKEGLVGKATALEDKGEAQRLEGLKLKIDAEGKVAQLNAGLAGTEMQTAASLTTAKMAANKETDLARQTNIRYAALLEEGKPANKKTMAEAASMAASDLGRYPGAEKLDVAREAAASKSKKEANESWGNAVLTDKNLRKTYSDLQKADPTGEQAASFKDRWVAREMGTAPAAAPAAAPQAAAPVAKPSMQVFMDAARKANPGVSDADLAAYYNRKYGK
jgi:hypothetical protein